MRSIDRLREYVCDMTSVSSMTKANMGIYLDAIEQEVEGMRDRDYRNGREDAEGAVEFADRLCRAAERREDVTLWGVDYTPLPVDADGVPINVGDAMEADNGTTFEVEHISLYQWGWRCVGEGTDRSGVTCTAHAIPDGCRHHHAPTVEDLLREYALKCEEAGNSGPEVKRLATEYAARLMLAGEGE
ncbi:MAG: hypothetical protein IKG18_07035 [Atopobiaceae bacterium]|nr:hypothetical protein [Atopobiaceae bacterium]